MERQQFKERGIIYLRKSLKIVGIALLFHVLLFLGILLALRWVNPPFTAFTLQQNWEQLGEPRYNLRSYWVPEEELPEHLKLAVIASEDQRFYEHFGLDFEAIRQALNENKQGNTRRGASTITQQVAKNLFLTPSQSYARKGIEAVIAVLQECFWNKERILEMYLNTAEFGPAVFGVGKASHTFYRKIPSMLEPGESARLAAVLPSPKRFRAEPPTPFVMERSNWILRQMTYLSGFAYYTPPAPETIPADSSMAADSLSEPQFTASHIGRAEVPDSLARLTDRDPLLDSAWTDQSGIW